MLVSAGGAAMRSLVWPTGVVRLGLGLGGGADPQEHDGKG